MFVIKNSNIKDYNAFVYWTCYDSIFDHLDELEEKLAKTLQSSGMVLFDQLFLTGDNYNRFFACEFENGKLNFKTAKAAFPPDKIKEELISQYS